MEALTIIKTGYSLKIESKDYGCLSDVIKFHKDTLSDINYIYNDKKLIQHG